MNYYIRRLTQYVALMMAAGIVCLAFMQVFEMLFMKGACK